MEAIKRWAASDRAGVEVLTVYMAVIAVAGIVFGCAKGCGVCFFFWSMARSVV